MAHEAFSLRCTMPAARIHHAVPWLKPSNLAWAPLAKIIAFQFTHGRGLFLLSVAMVLVSYFKVKFSLRKRKRAAAEGATRFLQSGGLPD